MAALCAAAVVPLDSLAALLHGDAPATVLCRLALVDAPGLWATCSFSAAPGGGVDLAVARELRRDGGAAGGGPGAARVERLSIILLGARVRCWGQAAAPRLTGHGLKRRGCSGKTQSSLLGRKPPTTRHRAPHPATKGAEQVEVASHLRLACPFKPTEPCVVKGLLQTAALQRWCADSACRLRMVLAAYGRAEPAGSSAGGGGTSQTNAHGGEASAGAAVLRVAPPSASCPPGFAPTLGGPFCDVALVADGDGSGGAAAPLRAHRVVLSAASPVLAAMLGGPEWAESSAPEVTIGEADPECLELLVRHVYGAAVDVPLGLAPRLYGLADRLQLRTELAPQLLGWLAAVEPTPRVLCRLFPDAHRCGHVKSRGLGAASLSDRNGLGLPGIRPSSRRAQRFAAAHKCAASKPRPPPPAAATTPQGCARAPARRA
jgi:hypothetical protein